MQIGSRLLPWRIAYGRGPAHGQRRHCCTCEYAQLDRPEEDIEGLPRVIAASVGRDINDVYRGNNNGVLDDVELNTKIVEESAFGLEPIRTDLLKRAVDYYHTKKHRRRKAAAARCGNKRARAWPGQGIPDGSTGGGGGGAKAHGPKTTTDYGNTKLKKKFATWRCDTRSVKSSLRHPNLLIWNPLHELPMHKTRELQRLAPQAVRVFFFQCTHFGSLRGTRGTRRALSGRPRQYVHGGCQFATRCGRVYYFETRRARLDSDGIGAVGIAIEG